MQNGNTLLISAAENGKIELMQYLLKTAAEQGPEEAKQAKAKVTAFINHENKVRTDSVIANAVLPSLLGEARVYRWHRVIRVIAVIAVCRTSKPPCIELLFATRWRA